MPTPDDPGTPGPESSAAVKWRSLVGSDNLVSRKLTLVLPRWLAQQLTDQAAAAQCRIEDVIVKRLTESAPSRPEGT